MIRKRVSKLNKRGAIDLPVKLMAAVLIVSLSVPLLTDAIERGESDNATVLMNSEIDKIFNAVAAVHYSGIENSRAVSIRIPGGCEIVIPGGDGPDSYSMKTVFKGKQTGVKNMDRPPVRFITDGLTISGSCTLLITGDVIDGHSAVRVSVV